MVSERDKGMRAAALGILARLHMAVGAAATWSLLGQLKDQQRSLIEERFKHKDRHADTSGAASTSYVSSWCAHGAPTECCMPAPLHTTHQHGHATFQWTGSRNLAADIRAGWTSQVPATAAARAPPPAAAGRRQPTLRSMPFRPRPASQSGEGRAWVIACTASPSCIPEVLTIVGVCLPGGRAAARWSTREQNRLGLARPGARTSAACPHPFQQPRPRPPHRWLRAGRCRCRCRERCSSSPAT